MPTRLQPLLSPHGIAGTSALGDDFARKADEYLNRELKAETFMGSVMVARSGKINFIKGYGLANREHAVPNAPNTKFRLGSIAKQFTAVSILKLQEQGKLSLDDPVSKYEENCPEGWSAIKIHHLLSHTSGIPSYTSFADYFYTKKFHWPPGKMIQRFRDKPLEFRPGEGFKYSNSGYFVLGYIVEQSSGKCYEDYLKENIFDPLGMANSGYDHFEFILPHRAAGYCRDGAGWKNSAYVDMSVPYAAGALYSTAEDFFLWYQCWREQKILSKSSWKALTTPSANHHGFGVFILARFGHRVLEHGGSINGFNTFMSWYPDADLFICAFGNADSARSDNVVKNLAAIKFDQPLLLPKERAVIWLDSKQLEILAGRYEIRGNFILTVTVIKHRLMVQATGQNKVEFYAESDTKCFGKTVNAEITFCKDSAGKVTHLVLHQNGDHTARRLEA